MPSDLLSDFLAYQQIVACAAMNHVTYLSLPPCFLFLILCVIYLQSNSSTPYLVFCSYSSDTIPIPLLGEDL